MARKRHKHKVTKPSQFKPEEPEKESAQKTEHDEGKQEEAPAPIESESHMRMSVIIYALAGIAVGYISLLLSPIIGNIYTILAGLVLAWLVGKVVQLTLGRKQLKWLLGNGLIIYLFVWLISWIFFFNYLGIAA
jgi:hypothetical protein